MNRQDRMLLKMLLNNEPCKREKFEGGNAYETNISQHDYWRSKAREEAYEAAKFAQLLREAMPREDVAGVKRYMENKLKLVSLYLHRADQFAGKAMLAKKLATAGIVTTRRSDSLQRTAVVEKCG